MVKNIIALRQGLTVGGSQSVCPLVGVLRGEGLTVTLNCVLCAVVFVESGLTPQLAWHY